MKSCLLLVGGALAGLALAAPKSSSPTTLTYTATKTLTSSTTVSGHNTIYTTSTITRPYTFPIYHHVYNETITTVYTSTESAGTTIRPKSTTAVPTPSGFTPLLKESPYTDKLDIEKTTTTTTTTGTFDPSPTTRPGTFVQVYGTFTTLTTTGPSYVVPTTSVTATTTARPSVYTDYAGCHKDNLATKIPTGQPLNQVGQDGDTGYNVTYTDSAQDCCNFCFSTPNCFGGSFEDGPQSAVPGRCFVFTLELERDNQKCDGSIAHGSYGHSPGTNSTGTWAFNGPCGQLSWGFSSGDYV